MNLIFNPFNLLFFLKNPKSNPHTKFYTKQELDASYKIETPFNTISEKWNEYIISDEVNKIEIKKILLLRFKNQTLYYKMVILFIM